MTSDRKWHDPVCVEHGCQSLLLEDRAERYREALEQIQRWCKAYPLDIFPEPDFKKAHELLQAGGMTLDGVSASAMRRVLDGVAEIVEKALAAAP